MRARRGMTIFEVSRGRHHSSSTISFPILHAVLRQYTIVVHLLLFHDLCACDTSCHFVSYKSLAFLSSP
jgi:hypothetical protein